MRGKYQRDHDGIHIYHIYKGNDVKGSSTYSTVVFDRKSIYSTGV